MIDSFTIHCKYRVYSSKPEPEKHCHLLDDPCYTAYTADLSDKTRKLLTEGRIDELLQLLEEKFDEFYPDEEAEC